MQVILRADIDTLGRLGDIVTVKAGYGRNYLIPHRFATVATAANLKQFELERRKLQIAADSLRGEAQSLADRIAKTPTEILVRVGESDKLYGAVTASNIAQTLTELGLEVDRRKILLDEPIRSLGVYDIEIKLHPEVRAVLKLTIARHGVNLAEMEEQMAPMKEESAVETTEEESAE